MMSTAEMIDALKGEDEPQRLSSIKKLATIADAIGEERTRTELIQYLAGGSTPLTTIYSPDTLLPSVSFRKCL
jgi:hypothetical protein